MAKRKPTRKKTLPPGSPQEEKKQQTPEKNLVLAVGVGASAGGLEAFTELLEHLPLDTGMALVLVQHLHPKRESLLTQLLSRATSLPVTEITNDIKIEANHIYVIPPGSNLAVLHGALKLMPRDPKQHDTKPIDYFFESLAADFGKRAIGVILSGTATDGVLGQKAIKAAGGITFAQDDVTAKFFGMPGSAIAERCIDFVLPPAKIAMELGRLAKHPYLHQSEKPEHEVQSELPSDEDHLDKFIVLLRRVIGVDFSYYKRNTLQRRVQRRLLLNKIESYADYLKFLNDNPAEIEALYQDILIHVTSFFRDPDSYQALATTVFPKIMENRSAETPLRIWVPGCSTGEEAYTLVICLLEYLGDKVSNTPIQLFATDISETAVEKGRSGLYAENISAHVSADRLRRFFVKTEGGYQIRKSVRDCCIFARQNLAQDPPFSRIDLISCRNVLIYMDPILQKRIFNTLHFSLRPTGFLILGSSESTGGATGLFALKNKKHKIYSKKFSTVRRQINFSLDNYDTLLNAPPIKQLREHGQVDIVKEADRIAIQHYVPAGVVINNDMEILQFRGRTGPYLEPVPGKASLNLLKMIRSELLPDVRAVIQQARKTQNTEKADGLHIRNNGGERRVNLVVIPFNKVEIEEVFFLVLFEEISVPSIQETTLPKNKSPKRQSAELTTPRIEELEKELQVVKRHLQSTLEEQESINEELRSANEEIQSSNEELQSSNEELETAKEELQSTNEELTTMNEELENRNEELSLVNGDLTNLLNSVQMPIIMLSSDLCIRRFTPLATQAFNIIPTDIGRKISDIKPTIEIPSLEKMILQVVNSLETVRTEVKNTDGHWYYLVIRPYRTLDNKIDGVVLMLVDIDSHKKQEKALEKEKKQAQKMELMEKDARMLSEAIVQTVREPLLVLNQDLRVIKANKAFFNAFATKEKNTIGKYIFELGNKQWDIPQLRQLLEEIIPFNHFLEDFPVQHKFPNIGMRKMLLNAHRIDFIENAKNYLLLAMEDITGKAERSG